MKTTVETILEVAHAVRRELMLSTTDSEGWCFETSCMILERLTKAGVQAYLVQGHVQVSHRRSYFHYWVEVCDYIVDATGDQFNKWMDPRDHIPAVLYEPAVNRPYVKSQVYSLPPRVQYEWAFALKPIGAY